MTLADRVVDASRAPAGAEVRRALSHSVLDWVGVSLAGDREPLAGMVADTLLRSGEGRVGILRRPNRGPAWDAALVAGTVGHALDYDDTHLVMPWHPTAPVLPALLALAEQEGGSGEHVVRALNAGVEAGCRLAAAVGRPHYDAGFHATATIGTFAAALACADLLGLDDGARAQAAGIAASHAAGLKAQFGTMGKSLQVGRAAADGVRSALLARAGVTVAPDALEAFAATHHGAVAEPGDGGGEPAALGIVFKYHASCHLTHATLENCAALRADGLRDDEVEAVEVVVAEPVLDVCDIATPTTGLQAKFSLRATAALGLLGDDTASPATFSDERATAADVAALGDRVRVRPVDDGALTWSALRVRLRGGRELIAETDVGNPETDLDERERRLRAKFTALAGAEAAGLADLALGLAELPRASALLEATRAGG